MAKIAAIKISEQQMPWFFLMGEVEAKEGDFCVVPRDKSETVGFIASIESHPCPMTEQCPHFPRILRRATDDEITRWRAVKQREREAIVACKQKAADHGLPMKISTVEIDEAHNKIIFHFTADKRVDFRALVRDLAATLRARIELWQIGVRDEAKIIDGYGICGERLCCSGYFREFKPISIRMAKNQDIALAPSKLSGCCGRLMCCLAYEENTYVELAQNIPPIGSVIRAANFEGTVVDRNILRGTLQIMDHDDKTHSIKVSEISEIVELRDRKGRQIKRLQDMEQEADEVKVAEAIPEDEGTAE